MFEQQNIDAADSAVNPARELSANVFSEQVSQHQKCESHVPRPPEIESAAAINDSLNQQLNENIYNKGSVENQNSQSNDKDSNQQIAFDSNRAALQLKENGITLEERDNIINQDVDPRISIINGGNTDKGIEIDNAIEVAPGRLSSDDGTPRTEEQRVAEAVDWAKDNFNRFDLHKDGLLQKWELDLPQITEEASEYDLEMLKILSENKDKIKFAHIDDFDVRRGEGRDGITMKDLNVLEKRLENRTVFQNAEIESRDLAKTLLKGEKPLFDFLDRASNGQNDGKIAKGDLERYMTDYEYLKQYGVNSGPYSQENVDAVTRMLESWELNTFPGPGTRMRGIIDIDNVHDHLFKHRRDRKYRYITRDKVVRAAGLG